MRMIPCKRIPIMGKNYAILKEFIDSDQDFVKIEGFPHKNPKSCQSCLCTSRRRYGFNNIGIVKRGEEIFLFRKDRVD